MCYCVVAFCRHLALGVLNQSWLSSVLPIYIKQASVIRPEIGSAHGKTPKETCGFLCVYVFVCLFGGVSQPLTNKWKTPRQVDGAASAVWGAASRNWRMNWKSNREIQTEEQLEGLWLLCSQNCVCNLGHSRNTEGQCWLLVHVLYVYRTWDSSYCFLGTLASNNHHVLSKWKKLGNTWKKHLFGCFWVKKFLSGWRWAG